MNPATSAGILPACRPVDAHQQLFKGTVVYTLTQDSHFGELSKNSLFPRLVRDGDQFKVHIECPEMGSSSGMGFDQLAGLTMNAYKPLEISIVQDESTSPSLPLLDADCLRIHFPCNCVAGDVSAPGHEEYEDQPLREIIYKVADFDGLRVRFTHAEDSTASPIRSSASASSVSATASAAAPPRGRIKSSHTDWGVYRGCGIM